MKDFSLLSYLVCKKRSGRVCFFKTVRWLSVCRLEQQFKSLSIVVWCVCASAEAHIKSSPPTRRERKINTEIRRLRGGAGDYFLPRT